MNPDEFLSYLYRSRAEGCTRCQLHATRDKVVFGVGDADADLVLVGEGPGAEEDRLGEPFVGASGKILDGILRRVGLDRERPGLYICNVVKCRPPGNRDPEPEEQAACAPFLHTQLRIIRPRVIVTLGRVPGMYLTGQLDDDVTVGYLRNHLWEYANGVTGLRCPLVCTYHPSYVLRNLDSDPPQARTATIKMIADLEKALRVIDPSP